MRSLWAVIAFETCQRRLVFLAALVLGLLPWAMPLLWPSQDAADLRLASASIVGLFLSCSLAIGLGATAAGSDLSSGRMGFFYAQPLSGAVIALGKMCAVVLVSASPLLIVTAPVLLFGVTERTTYSGQLLHLGVVCIIVIVGLAIGSHVVSVAVRARTGWLALTAAALIGIGLVAVVNGRVLGRLVSPALWLIVSSATMLATLLALFISSWFQFRSGRADLQRSGRALAIATACTLLVVALGSFVYSSWAGRPTFDDLRGVHYVGEVGAGWLRVTGPVRWRPGYEATFLFRPSDRANLRIQRLPFQNLPSRLVHASSASAAGAYISLRAGRRNDSWDLTIDWVDLTATSPSVEATGVSLFGLPRHLELSPSGRTLALIAPDALRGGRQRLVAHEMPSGRIIAAVDLPEGIISENSWLGFDDEETLRLVAGERLGSGYGVSRRTFSIASDSLSEPFWVPDLVVNYRNQFYFSPDGDPVSDGHALYSTRSGLQLLTFAEPSGSSWKFPLGGDLWARWVTNRDGVELRILSSGEHPNKIMFPGATWPGFHGRLDSGKLLLTVKDRSADSEARWQRALWLVDPGDGARRLLHESVYAVAVSEGGTIHVADCFGNLIEVDAETAERNTLVAGELPYHPPDSRPNPSWLPMTVTSLLESITVALP